MSISASSGSRLCGAKKTINFIVLAAFFFQTCTAFAVDPKKSAEPNPALTVVNLSTPAVSIPAQDAGAPLTGPPISITTYVADTPAQVDEMVDLLREEVGQSPGGLGGVLLPTPESEPVDSNLIKIAKRIKPQIIKEKIQKLVIPKAGYKDWFSKSENRTRVICTAIRAVGVGTSTGLVMYSRYGNTKGAIALAVVTAIQSGLLSWNTERYVKWLEGNNSHLTKKFGVNESSGLGETLVSAERLNKFFFTEAVYALPMIAAMAFTGIPLTSFHAFFLSALSGTLTQGASDTGSGINYKIDKRELRQLSPGARGKAEARAKIVAMTLGTTASIIEVASAALQMAGGTSDMVSTGGFLVLGLFGWTVFARGLFRQRELRDLKNDVTSRRQMGREYRLSDEMKSSINPLRYSEIYHFDWKPVESTYTANNPNVYGSILNLDWPSEKGLMRTADSELTCSNMYK